MTRIAACGVAFFFVIGLLRADDASKPLPPTAADVSYGPNQRNVLDFWKAPGDGPRPLLVHIHGGGWTAGDKQVAADRIRPFLERGISFASINYRLTGEAILPAPVHDAARAIQFLRTKAEEWNIDSQGIALIGTSAGACSSMWLLLHDDLADPKAEDPVLRQSTRVCAAVGIAGQTSIDPKVVEEWVGPNILQHRMINLSVGEPNIDAALRNYDRHRALYHEFSPINHLDADDPPLFLRYEGNMKLPSENAGHGIHHPVLGVKMKEQADRVGVECHLLIPGVSVPEAFADENEFLIQKLLEATPKAPR
jgi:acetyl esterase/lipase